MCMERNYVKGHPAGFVLYFLVFKRLGKKATVYPRCSPNLFDCLFSGDNRMDGLGKQILEGMETLLVNHFYGLI